MTIHGILVATVIFAALLTSIAALMWWSRFIMNNLYEHTIICTVMFVAPIFTPVWILIAVELS